MSAPIFRILRILHATSILLSLCCAVTLATDYIISTNPDLTSYTLAIGDSLTAGITATHSGSLTISGNSTLSTGQNSLTSTGSITGTTGTTFTKTGAGTWKITGANQNFGSNIELTEGTLHVTDRYAIGTNSVSISAGATLTWNAPTSGTIQHNLTNQFTGTGTLYLLDLGNFMTDDSTRPLSNYLSGFTGTLKIGCDTRFRLDQGASDAAGLNQLKEIIVESGGQLWLNKTSYELSTKITLAGKGWKEEEGTSWGALGAMRLSNDFKTTGALELAGDTELCFNGACTANYAGGTELNGHNLLISGNGSAGTAIFGGPITSTGGKLGTIQLTANNSSLKFTTIPGETKTQELDANINVGSHPVTFVADAGYTLQLNGTLTATGSVTKEGAGTFVFADSQTLKTLTVKEGSLLVSEGATLKADSMTLSPNALVNLTLSSESPTTANLEFTGTLTSSALGGEIALSKELGSTIDYGDSFLLVTAGSMTDEEFTKLNFASSNDSVIDYPGGRWSYSLQSLGTGVGIYATALDANAVPEPSTWILLAFGILGLLKYRVIQGAGKH